MSSTIDRSAKSQVRPQTGGALDAQAVAQRVGTQQVAEELGARDEALFYDLWGGTSFNHPEGRDALSKRARAFADDADSSFASAEPPRKVGGTKKKKDA